MTTPGASVASENNDQFVRFVLTDVDDNIEVPNWSITSEELGLGGSVPFKIWKKTLHGGKQEGSTLVGIEAGDLSVLVVPTRGMGIYKAHYRGVEFGWKSPVDEIVHPSFMDLTGRGGLGWLEGFNELMVRCGYEWTGHPYRDGDRMFTLHGRAANTPASLVTVEVERQAPHRITLTGLLKEKTFAFANLETRTELVIEPGTGALHIHDRLTNKSDVTSPYQIIYHTNFGLPLLGEGARIMAPVKCVVPLDDAATKNLENWQRYSGPKSGFVEELYGLVLHKDSGRRTLVALVGADGSRGVALRFSLDQLPFFTLWKNTDSHEQGYVTGLEPASNYPHPRKEEEAHGRLQHLGPGKTQEFDLTIQFLVDQYDVAKVASEIEGLQAPV
jgi:galactose mutarotase-like enzyme